MIHATRSARITGPVPYTSAGGKTLHVPLGPCMVEQVDDELIDIIWGLRGQSSAALPVEAVKAAKEMGNLVLLD